MRTLRAAFVGYTVLAVGIAGCGQKDEPASAPAPVVSAPAAPAAAPTDLQASLKAGFGSGTETVYLNDQKVGDYQADIQVDASQYVHAGENTLRVSWAQPASRDFTVSYAQGGQAPVEISKVSLNPTNTKAPGEQRVTFNLPGPDGKIPLTATTPAPTSTPGATGPTGAAPGPSPVASAPTAAPGTAVPVENEPPPAPSTPADSGGSHDKQTLLINHIAYGSAAVYVNGKKVGDFSGTYVPLDISSYVHPGANKMRVIWGKEEGHTSIIGSIDVSYAATKNNFRRIAGNGLTGPHGADKTITFNLPK